MHGRIGVTLSFLRDGCAHCGRSYCSAGYSVSLIVGTRVYTLPCFLPKGRRKNASFAVGHVALAYLLSWGSARLLHTKSNIAAIIALSVIPDVDILSEPFLQHRGVTHSIVVSFIVFVPVFVVYGKKAVPFFAALIQHSVLGDYFAGGSIQLFWPLTSQGFGINMSVYGILNVVVEWLLFALALIVLIVSRDIARFLQPHTSNIILCVPVFAVFLPSVFGFPLEVPFLLLLPHLAFLVLFSIGMLTGLVAWFSR